MDTTTVKALERRDASAKRLHGGVGYGRKGNPDVAKSHAVGFGREFQSTREDMPVNPK
jgi:hypothetical protein